jgi:L-histidine N-alpha-methyltransferase
LRDFEHRALWNEDQRRIEMHLRSRLDQTAFIAEADLTVAFRAGETIWTESSHKFLLDELDTMATDTGFGTAGRWIDNDWPFAESLWTVR